MEIDTIYYKAKDGKIFTDPLECENYEKTIGILDGSVGQLIQTLEEIPKERFCNAVLITRNKEGKRSIYSFQTVDCSDKLELFANPESLTEEQRYLSETIGGMIKLLKKLDKDDMCQYMLFHAATREFKNCGAMANLNNEVWK